MSIAKFFETLGFALLSTVVTLLSANVGVLNDAVSAVVERVFSVATVGQADVDNARTVAAIVVVGLTAALAAAKAQLDSNKPAE